MKKIITLAAASVLAASTFSAQAQVVVDGQLTAAEINGAASNGDYVKLGQYPYSHGFGDAGLLALYGANSATTVSIFVAGTLQPFPDGKNAFQIFIGLPNMTGVPAGTALPSPTTGTTTSSTTSFGKFNGILDQAANIGLAIHTNGTAGKYQVEAVVYRAMATTPVTYAAADTVISAMAMPLADNGTALMLPILATGRFRALSGASLAYLNAPMGMLSMNLGYVAPNTANGNYGGIGSTGLEVQFNRVALGLATGTPVVNLFVQQNNGGGDYVSSDYLPNAAVPPTANGGNLTGNPDYTKIAGTQSAPLTLVVAALATKAADEASVAMSVYPNPIHGATTVAYTVAGHAENVNIILTDLLGRKVHVFECGMKAVGTQSIVVRTADVAAGTYLMRVQVGDKAATRKVVLL